MGRYGNGQVNAGKRKDMMATAMVADFDTISGCYAHQRFDPPVARVVAHSLKLFIRR